MPVSAQRDTHPRLYQPVGESAGVFALPEDPQRQRILNNIIADCNVYGRRRPWARIAERFDSPHPYHQLYITFYTAMQATALIEHYAFAWKLTGNPAWLKRAKAWLMAAAGWEHSDRIEEHFYTANRYMHAFAIGLDLLWDQLSNDEEQRVTDCLVRQMERWWPDVRDQRHSPEGGHHAVVDNGHFGLAALHLLGKHSEAPAWVEAVVERFRDAIMPNGCGGRGEPVDGASFWTWENLWLLHFADALHNVVGIDLYAEFPQRMIRPLEWFRYQLVDQDSAQGAGRRAAWSPTLLRLAQDAGDAHLRAVALGDPALGRIYRFMAGVKGTSAECMIAYGPYAYIYCDPGFKAGPVKRRAMPLSRIFKARYGDAALLRDGWDDSGLVVQVCGYDGGVAHNFSELHLHWAGQPLLKNISSEEAQPVGCGSLPSVGGQNESLAHLGTLTRTPAWDRLKLRSRRLLQEYWLLRGPTPMLVVALKRRVRGLKLVRSQDEAFVRLDGSDYLQYPRQAYFNPSAGTLRLRVRLGEGLKKGDRPRILFNTGLGIGTGGLGPQVNNYTLGLDAEGLFFRVQSQRGHCVEVRIAGRVGTRQWHEINATWGGFNHPKGTPFIELGLDGVIERCDDSSRFGELGLDSQNLRSRTTPRAFYIKSNTLLAFGGAVQIAATETVCDIDRIDLCCPEREPLRLDFSKGLGNETGSEPPSWKLNPVDLRALTTTKARFGAGKQGVEVLPAYPKQVRFQRETVPFAPAGLAAGSLRQLAPGGNEDATRVLAQAAAGDLLVLAFVPGRAKARIEKDAEGFVLQSGKVRFDFCISSAASQILRLDEA